MSLNLGQYLIKLLEVHSVDIVFGIPGVHTAELYRGLATSPIRHITPRHEQGAGFMADGYARVSGKPGVCFVITGPGLANISTAMLQAMADSIPMLVIAGANDTSPHPKGRLHEMPDQAAFAREVSALSRRIERPEDLPEAFADAFALFDSGRPGPALIEIPLSRMALDASRLPPPRRAAAPAPVVPNHGLLVAAAALFTEAAKPVILMGGGAKNATKRVLTIAERFDAPIVTTVNARGLLPIDHPLAVPATASLDPVRDLVNEAHLVLAIGTEIGPTDYDVYAEGKNIHPKRLIRIDIDPDRTVSAVKADMLLRGDAEATLAALEPLLPQAPIVGNGAERAAHARKASLEALSSAYRTLISLLDIMRDAFPDAVMAGDSTQLIYAGNMMFAPGTKAAWFNSATGFGTLGYGLPAAIGAKFAKPGRPVLCLIGDGGLQFTLGELGVIRDHDAPVVVLVWNNSGYGEIRSYMLDNGVKPEGVDPSPPDFDKIAEAYGLGYRQLTPADNLKVMLEPALKTAFADPRGMILEIVAS